MRYARLNINSVRVPGCANNRLRTGHVCLNCGFSLRSLVNTIWSCDETKMLLGTNSPVRQAEYTAEVTACTNEEKRL